jgi:serine protease Do
MRRFVIFTVAGILASSAAAWGQDSSLGEAQVIDKAMTEAIRKAEPAIASIFVSRSNEYRKLLKDSPPEDQPGELRGFHAEKAKKILAATIKESGRLEAELRKLDLSDPEHVPESYGSGVVISAQGLVLTNFHVVRDAAKIYVRLPGGKGSYANIHAADSRSDLAGLRLLDSSLAPLPFLRPSGGEVHKGQLILTMVNPFAPGLRDASPRAGWGIVSNLRQKRTNPPQDPMKWTFQHHGTLIQTDRSLPLGSSGGALVNLQGELVGLITSQTGVTGDGAYAVPLDASMSRIIQVLEKGEEVEYGFLGIHFGSRDFPFQARPRVPGVSFGGVIRGSPAEKAGLMDRDVILAVDDVPVYERSDLMLAVGKALAGSIVRLKVLRSSQQTEVLPVTVAKFNQIEPFIASVKHPFARGIRVDDTSVIAQRNQGEGIPPGVFVREVEKGSAAEAAQLQGANIIAVDDKEVQSPADFYQKMRKTGPVELTLASVDNKGRPLKVKLN